MGALSSRQNVGAEEIGISQLHVYKYPPKSGTYFDDHFIMGGEKFESQSPEAYLFGENTDLNFLGSRPISFPYPPPQSNEPTKTLKSRVNIRKESLRLVKINDTNATKSDDNSIKNTSATSDDELISSVNNKQMYNIEFIFDADCDVEITIHYFVKEELTPNGVVFSTNDKSFTSKTYRYSIGSNQLFYQPEHVLNPLKYTMDDLSYFFEKEILPVAIHCVTTEANDLLKESHTTIAIIERHTDGLFFLKALKQKIFIDGLCYLLQEIYGIENKQMKQMSNRTSNYIETEDDDNGSECVICMCDIRDTLILPCRHLCLCHSCADSLRYQANNCPICRSPFRALLQIKALREKLNVNKESSSETTVSTNKEVNVNQDNVPNGFESVSLIEALNGPYIRSIKERSNSDKSLRKHQKSFDSAKSDNSNTRNNELNENSLDENPGDKSSNSDDIGSSPLLFIKRNNNNKKDKVIIVDESNRSILNLSKILKINDEDADDGDDNQLSFEMSSSNINNDEIEEDLDSEAEKLSPLLSNDDSNNENDCNYSTNSGKIQQSSSKDREIHDQDIS